MIAVAEVAEADDPVAVELVLPVGVDDDDPASAAAFALPLLGDALVGRDALEGGAAVGAQASAGASDAAPPSIADASVSLAGGGTTRFEYRDLSSSDVVGVAPSAAPSALGLLANGSPPSSSESDDESPGLSARTATDRLLPGPPRPSNTALACSSPLDVLGSTASGLPCLRRRHCTAANAATAATSTAVVDNATARMLFLDRPSSAADTDRSSDMKGKGIDDGDAVPLALRLGNEPVGAGSGDGIDDADAPPASFPLASEGLGGDVGDATSSVDDAGGCVTVTTAPDGDGAIVTGSDVGDGCWREDGCSGIVDTAVRVGVGVAVRVGAASKRKQNSPQDVKLLEPITGGGNTTPLRTIRCRRCAYCVGGRRYKSGGRRCCRSSWCCIHMATKGMAGPQHGNSTTVQNSSIDRQLLRTVCSR